MEKTNNNNNNEKKTSPLPLEETGGGGGQLYVLVMQCGYSDVSGVKARPQANTHTHPFALGITERGERSLALACINKIEPCMAYANPDRGSW